MSNNDQPKSYRNFVDQNFPTIQYHFVEMMSEHLADCSRTFKGDLQQVVILALIGQVLIEHYRKNGGDVSQTRGISTSRLSDLTGIPRQTIRRKLAILANQGWIEQTVQGSWRMVASDGTTKAGKDLSALNERNRDRIARFLSTVSPLLKTQ